ncbi:MAG TPA: hypothetical protein VGM29_06415 [Polyangiaceae bacterium]|jgi:hypothetical protein
MRAIRAKLAALVAVLVLVLPGSAWARAHYVCRMTGASMSARCCKSPCADPGSRDPQVLPLDCCERVAPAARASTLGTRVVASDVAPAALAALVNEPSYLPPRSLAVRVAPAQARAPPPRGSPLYLVHCALLS